MMLGSFSFNIISAKNVNPKTVLRLFSISASKSSRNMSDDRPTQTMSYVTIQDDEEARKLARSMVENRLAACVNIVKQVKSIYEWQGKIEEESESMLIIKSDSSKTTQLTRFVETNHPYDCPEIVSIKIDSGSDKYLNWISESLAKAPLTQPGK